MPAPRDESCIYILPHPHYFSQGGRGRVTHALGVVEGMRDNGIAVTVVSGRIGPAIRRQLEAHGAVYEVPPTWVGGRIRWLDNLKRVVARALMERSPTFGIIRYSRMAAPLLQGIYHHRPPRTWVTEVNSLAFQDVSPQMRGLRRAIRRHEGRLLRASDVVYTVSDGLRDDLTAGGLIAEERVISIPNAAEGWLWSSTGARVDRSHGVERSDRTVFLYLGRLQSYYDFDTLCAAFRLLVETGAQVELHVFGSGEQEPGLARFAGECPGVRLHGEYELRTLIDKGAIGPEHVAMLPYDWKPGDVQRSPVKLYEYMALGLPIVAARVPPVSDVLRDGETAYFYEPGDVASAARAMGSAACNAEERLRRGRLAWNEGRHKHTWRDRMATLLSRVASESDRDGLTRREDFRE